MALIQHLIHYIFGLPPQLWDYLVSAAPLPILVPATLNRVDFLLCQAMQPSSVPFPENMLRLPSSEAKNATGVSYCKFFSLMLMTIFTRGEMG